MERIEKLCDSLWQLVFPSYWLMLYHWYLLSSTCTIICLIAKVALDAHFIQFYKYRATEEHCTIWWLHTLFDFGSKACSTKFKKFTTVGIFKYVCYAKIFDLNFNLNQLESSEEMKGFLDEVNRKNDRIVAISLKYSPLGSAIYLAAIGISNVLYCLLKYGYVSADHLFYPARFSYVFKLSSFVMKMLKLYCEFARFKIAMGSEHHCRLDWNVNLCNAQLCRIYFLEHSVHGFVRFNL